MVSQVLGVALGYVIPPHIIVSGADFYTFYWVTAVISTVVALLTLVGFRADPLQNPHSRTMDQNARHRRQHHDHDKYKLLSVDFEHMRVSDSARGSPKGSVSLTEQNDNHHDLPDLGSPKEFSLDTAPNKWYLNQPINNLHLNGSTGSSQSELLVQMLESSSTCSVVAPSSADSDASKSAKEDETIFESIWRILHDSSYVALCIGRSLIMGESLQEHRILTVKLWIP